MLVNWANSELRLRKSEPSGRWKMSAMVDYKKEWQEVGKRRD